MEDYMRNKEECGMNACCSVVFDVLNVAEIFGVLEEVVNMARRGHFWPKVMWKKKIWDRAWELDICFWKVHARCHRSLGLFSSICGGPGFLIWWQIANDDCSLST